MFDPKLRFERTRAQFPFIATARDGSSSMWTFEIEPNLKEGIAMWVARARPVDDAYDGVDWYELNLVGVDDETVRLDTVTNHLCRQFHSRGVGPTLFSEVARQLRKRLLSSRGVVEDSTEVRSARLAQIWTLLVSRGDAQQIDGADQFVIDGRPGHGQRIGGRVLPMPQCQAPTSEADFAALMDSVDAALRAKGAPIFGRELGAIGEVARLLATAIYPQLAKGEPLPGVYEGVDLAIRIKHWFDARYGDKQKVDFSPGRTVVMIRGDVWTVKVPLIVGPFMIFASRTEASDPPREVRTDGVPFKLNALDWIEKLPPGLKAVLTDDELAMCRERCLNAWNALAVMRACEKETYAAEVLTDHRATVDHLSNQPVHAGQARWSALQATEKMYKSYIVAMGGAIPKGRHGHDLTLLSKVAEQFGLIQADQYYIDLVQCSADVRYGDIEVSMTEAVEAHHAALELCYHIADELRRQKNLPIPAL